MLKSLATISWNVTESEYRADPALSYSTLATFNRCGFNGLSTLFDRKESPSLSFGSAVDTMMTDGTEAFKQQFYIADIDVSDTIAGMVKSLFKEFNTKHKKLAHIPMEEVLSYIISYNYQPRWKDITRYNDVVDKGSKYYDTLYLAGDKTILSTSTYNRVILDCRALLESPQTADFFAPNNPFDGIERLYQLKFKATLEGIDFRCMADIIYVDHNKKTVQPIDLKTSSHHEWDFFKSFVEWNYQIQARLYWRIIKYVIEHDDYFKDFTLLPYKFIVVANNTDKPIPLVWDCDFTSAMGTLYFGKNNTIEFRDPFDIAKELRTYLDTPCEVPIGIDIKGSNNLRTYLNTL